MLPRVVQDPRFRAGRSLVRKGKAGPAVEIFATLLEEARTTFGEASIESAPAYYEYGNALLRDFSSSEQPLPPDEEETTNYDRDRPQTLDPREAAAQAAEKRRTQKEQASSSDEQTLMDKNVTEEEEEQGEEGAIHQQGDEKDDGQGDEKDDEQDDEGDDDDDDDEEDDDDDDDVELALEMMETAWSILDVYMQTDDNDAAPKLFREWATEQSPRYLTGIGDALSSAGRHADAADAYSRALERRLDMLKQFKNNEQSKEHLNCRRLIVEANILIAEEFLACPKGQDVVTTETKDVLVKAVELVDYARGYYDKARDELQETVLLMGEMTAKGMDVTEEKEDICFASTMVMGVGMKLAELDDLAQMESQQPTKKKAKTS